MSKETEQQKQEHEQELINQQEQEGYTKEDAPETNVLEEEANEKADDN